MQTKRLIKGRFVCIFLIGYYSPDALGGAPNFVFEILLNF
ncbi:Protein of unknown function [Bacillus cereus]|nr:Protein of unknown function [Bacillus cereus]